MKFVLIAFVFASLQHESWQYDSIIYSQLFRPYNYNNNNNYNYYRYAPAPQPPPTVFRYPSRPTAAVYSVYRTSIPGIRSFGVAQQRTINNDHEMQSHLDNLLSRMKSTMMQMSSKQEQTDSNPNDVTYKGRRTRKTLASFRSASV